MQVTACRWRVSRGGGTVPMAPYCSAMSVIACHTTDVVDPSWQVIVSTSSLQATTVPRAHG
jgi:hypothetical protein